jgi:hypothetical protein
VAEFGERRLDQAGDRLTLLGAVGVGREGGEAVELGECGRLAVGDGEGWVEQAEADAVLAVPRWAAQPTGARRRSSFSITQRAGSAA